MIADVRMPDVVVNAPLSALLDDEHLGFVRMRLEHRVLPDPGRNHLMAEKCRLNVGEGGIVKRFAKVDPTNRRADRRGNVDSHIAHRLNPSCYGRSKLQKPVGRVDWTPKAAIRRNFRSTVLPTRELSMPPLAPEASSRLYPKCYANHQRSAILKPSACWVGRMWPCASFVDRAST